MGQHVQSLPVTFDLSGDVLVLQDHALSSTLTPFCRENKRKLKIDAFTQHYSLDNDYFSVFSPPSCQTFSVISQNVDMPLGNKQCILLVALLGFF